jgi:hypothetical protein
MLSPSIGSPIKYFLRNVEPAKGNFLHQCRICTRTQVAVFRSMLLLYSPEMGKGYSCSQNLFSLLRVQQQI